MKVAMADGRWQFHDFNLTTHPVAVASLIAGQTDYALAEIHQEIKHVYVKNADGKYVTLKPIDEREIANTGVSPEDYMSTDGMPQYYDKKGHSLFLYPAPSEDETTLVEGLKLSYVESPSYFTTSDTDTTAGINPLFQSYPEIYASHEYFLDNQHEKKERMYAEKLQIMEQEIEDYYSIRDNDDRPLLRPRRRNYV